MTATSLTRSAPTPPISTSAAFRSMWATTISGTTPSQLTLKQKQNENRKVTDKANELKEFIQRFAPTLPRQSKQLRGKSSWTN